MQSTGCRAQDSGCKVQGAGFRVQGSGCRVYDLGVVVLLKGGAQYLDHFRAKRKQRSKNFASKPRSKPGLDCLMCATFDSRQFTAESKRGFGLKGSDL